MHDRQTHSKTVEELVGSFRTDLDRGLTTVEARERLLEFGANELAGEERVSPIVLFLAQFKSTLIVILLVATVLSALLGEIVDAAIIAVIVLFCAVLSFVQEFRAGNALKALKKMLAPTIRVLRDGAEARIPSREVVPGDIVLLQSGSIVPADLRLITAAMKIIVDMERIGEQTTTGLIYITHHEEEMIPCIDHILKLEKKQRMLTAGDPAPESPGTGSPRETC